MTEKGTQSSESEEGVQDSSFYWNLPQTLNCSSELDKEWKKYYVDWV